MSLFRFFIATLLLFGLLASCGITNSNARGKAIDLAPETVAIIDFDTIQNLIIIEAEINGHTGKFLFDNGFTLSAIHPDFAKKTGVNFNRSTNVNDINNNKLNLSKTTVASIKIGDFDFKKTGFYSVDTKKFFPCHDIDGVIGGSIINKVNWKVRYRDRKIEISEMPFDFQDDTTVIDVTYNHGNSALAEIDILNHTFTCKIDIGMSGEMSIHKKNTAVFKGQEAIESNGISSLGASGLGNIERNYTVNKRFDISVGKTTLPVGAEIELDESQKYTGYIGVGYLKHYDFIVNSSEKQYILTHPVIPEEIDSMGYGVILYMVNDTCRIIQKIADDPLLENVPVLSIVTQINDLSTASFKSVCDLRAYLRNQGKKLADLTLSVDGIEEPLVLPYRKKPVVIVVDE